MKVGVQFALKIQCKLIPFYVKTNILLRREWNSYPGRFFPHILLSIKKSRLRIFKIFCFALRSGSIYNEFTYQTVPSPINLYEI